MAVAAHRGTTVWKLAERSVLPLFVQSDLPGKDGQPQRIGSGVLARLLNQSFIVTAAHVILNLEQVERGVLRFAPPGAQLTTLENARGYWWEPEPGGLDMGLIPISPQHAALFDELVFLPSADIGIEAERQPLSAEDNYIVCGFPSSNSRFKLDQAEFKIRQGSFTFHTGLATRPVAGCEDLRLESHLVLVFNEKQITLDGKRQNPPTPRGISGGCAFRAANGTLELAGIMAEHRRGSRVMVATRMAEFVAVAREVIDSERSQAR